ncbi:sulfate transporter family-domain-containing protein [Scleroderma citrinum]
MAHRGTEPAPSGLSLLLARKPPTSKDSDGSGTSIDEPSYIPHLPSIEERLDGLAITVISSIPAVVLGALLNVLDGLSYGMIIFPASGVFASLGGMGVSIFFVSTVIAQLVFTFGGSNFAGANGSMMIEAVPFFHLIASTIAHEIGEENVREVIATTLTAFALSSFLTGLTFFLLGYLRLGVLIGFFPRHILVGCIGGVGVFLVLTGLTVSTRVPSDALDPPTLQLLRYFTSDAHALAQWVPPVLLALLLRVITARWKHQLLFPIYFLIIPTVFYVIVVAAGLNLDKLRKDGWLFESAGLEDKWYGFYSYYDLDLIRWTAIWNTLPTQFALLFFNVLHPPLNVPALSVSLDQDIDTNQELVGHGCSNLLSALLGSVPNYLVYVNTLLFYRLGGGNRVAGFMLALVTFLLLIIGTAPIAYIPVVVVSTLIIVLGIDLVKEALWDPRHRVTKMEYITIISIMVTMTVWDFVIGVLFGIIVSCLFFVIQNSQRRSIRACYTGDAAMSTVRRPAAHRAYIREVSKQTRILQLQGFLFFGTIVHVEDKLRSIIDNPNWRQDPVRFVVVDLTLVAGVDMSSAEAFVRVQRLLAAKGVSLVFCGVSIKSTVGKALASSGILEEPQVELCETLNDAMEWTENAYLRAWFRVHKAESTPIALPGRQGLDIDFHETHTGSPRGVHLRDAGERTIADELFPKEMALEPLNSFLKVFQSYDEIDHDGLTKLVPYFERVSVPEGHILWEMGDAPDGLYIIQSGILRASYKFAEHTPVIEESMVSGTLAGELSGLSGLPRNATVMVERSAVLWRLSRTSMRQLEQDHPHLAQTFVRLVLKAAKVDTDVLLAALATR